MEREAHYAAVGAFVVLVVLMAGAFVYWYSDQRDAGHYNRYEVYFDGSVSGLTKGSTVRYLGVDVGRVVSMRIDARAETRVQVVVDINSEAPVSGETVAELSLQGVTGLLFIDLSAKRGTKKLTEPVPSERYPVIRSVRSSFDAFLSGLPEVVARSAEVAERVTVLLSNDNLKALGTLATNLEVASRGLPATIREIDLLAQDLRVTSGAVGQVALSLRNLSERSGPQIAATLENAQRISANLALSTAKLDRLLGDNQSNITAFTRDSLPEIEQLLREGREAAIEFQDLTRSLRADPAQLLHQTQEHGVEIPR
jgi:phospholipid/cholesterol/gamma-HCH transport system substrate-binding protein